MPRYSCRLYMAVSWSMTTGIGSPTGVGAAARSCHGLWRCDSLVAADLVNLNAAVGSCRQIAGRRSAESQDARLARSVQIAAAGVVTRTHTQRAHVTSRELRGLVAEQFVAP